MAAARRELPPRPPLLQAVAHHQISPETLICPKDGVAGPCYSFRARFRQCLLAPTWLVLCRSLERLLLPPAHYQLQTKISDG